MVPIAVGDNVICKAAEESNKTEGGLYIPETAMAQLPQKEAEVISVGEKCTADIQAGDTIVVHQQSGQVMVFGKDVYFVVKEPEVYGVVARKVE